ELRQEHGFTVPPGQKSRLFTVDQRVCDISKSHPFYLSARSSDDELDRWSDTGRKTDHVYATSYFCLWHKCEVPTALNKVRFQKQPGRHLLALSSSLFD